MFVSIELKLGAKGSLHEGHKHVDDTGNQETEPETDQTGGIGGTKSHESTNVDAHVYFCQLKFPKRAGDDLQKTFKYLDTVD